MSLIGGPTTKNLQAFVILYIFGNVRILFYAHVHLFLSHFIASRVGYIFMFDRISVGSEDTMQTNVWCAFTLRCIASYIVFSSPIFFSPIICTPDSPPVL